MDTMASSLEVSAAKFTDFAGPRILPAPAPVTVLAHPLVVKARDSAHQDFHDSTRKVPKGSQLTLLPYVVHLEDVASILADYGYGPEVIAAAYLHDHLEDRPKLWSKARLATEFTPYTAELVDWVTQQERKASWEDRNQAYAVRLQHAPEDAIALSLADKLSNIRSALRYMRMGYPVESILKRGWQENSAKFHRLDDVFLSRVPEAMYTEFRCALAQFDLLGPRVAKV